MKWGYNQLWGYKENVYDPPNTEFMILLFHPHYPLLLGRWVRHRSRMVPHRSTKIQQILLPAFPYWPLSSGAAAWAKKLLWRQSQNPASPERNQSFSEAQRNLLTCPHSLGLDFYILRGNTKITHQGTFVTNFLLAPEQVSWESQGLINSINTPIP